MPSPSNKRPRPESPRSIIVPPRSIPDNTGSDATTPSAPSAGGGGGGGGGGGHGASSSFRNVSACNRCRLRKNRCDQNLPACSSCAKANVKCVGYDPITKREIPRAYVYYLESRVSYLEELLGSRGVAFAPAEDFEVGTKQRADSSPPLSPLAERHKAPLPQSNGPPDRKQEEAEKLNKLVSNIGMVSVQGASDPRFLGSTSGISFARVVFAAVRNSVSGSTSDRAGLRPGKVSIGGATTSNFRDSFFGLQTKPAFSKAPFPDRELGARLANLYFEYANCQIPILHRGEFMALFDRTYATDERRRSPRELYMLNIVFAIGAGIILSAPGTQPPKDVTIKVEPSSPKTKRIKLPSEQCQAEEYHASAMVHLEHFLGSSSAADRPEGYGGSLEELQAVLLLAGFALLRPVAPGLWYIVGVAMRLGVDLGLHYEDGAGIEDSTDGVGVVRSHDVALQAAGVRPEVVDAREKGRREWVRDLRRRLWWCVYSFDRLVSTCVGRPFGITDQVITTEFPSVLDDNHITTSGFTAPPGAEKEPSYKRVAHHYFRLRLLQSEILQVLQYRQAKQARENGRNGSNEFMHTKLRSPFLDRHESFHSWRRDIDRRLFEWKESAPHQRETTVSFSVQFLELNYWQAVIMLYRQSLSVPPELDGEISPSSEIASPMETHNEEEDDEDVFLKVAEAGQKTLKIYFQLHKQSVVNYTFLATHHLFMAGIAFLYAIWHSVTVRSLLTLADVDYTVLAGTTVLRNLSEKCPPAEACRDAFDRMAKATIHMCLQSGGFGARPVPIAQTQLNPTSQPPPPRTSLSPQAQNFYHQSQNKHGLFRPHRPRPQFDMNLRDLFPDETPEAQNFRNIGRVNINMQPQMQHHQLQQQQQAAMMMATTPTPTQLSYDTRSVSPMGQPYPQGTPPGALQQHDTPMGLTSTPPPSSAYANFGGNNSPTATGGMHQHTGSSGAIAFNPTSMPSAATSNLGALQTDPYDDLGFRNDLDALLGTSSSTLGAYTGQGGMSLGFETDHDWNDGWAPDLFDGYWFGGNGVGAGAYAATGGAAGGMGGTGEPGQGNGMG